VAELWIDRVSGLSGVEKHGAFRSLNRTARVIFTEAELAGNRGPRALSQALGVLDVNGITVLSSLGTIRTGDSAFNPMVLVERAPSISENDPSCVDIALKYEHILDGPNQILMSPPSGVLFVKMRSSIMDKETNFFYPYGDKNYPRIQLAVSHTFPENYKGLPNHSFDTALPRTVKQSGVINSPFPAHNASLSGIVYTANPITIAKNLLAHINETPFLGQDPLTWLCTEVSYSVCNPNKVPGPIGQNRPSYYMNIEWQYNFDTWDPLVIFNDQSTGRPPADVRAADITDPDPDNPALLRYNLNPYNSAFQPAGYWSAPTLPRRDFETYFNAKFENNFPPVP